MAYRQDRIKPPRSTLHYTPVRLHSRPVQMLFPLEVRQVEPVPENPAVTQPAGDVQRPRREGAVTGKLRGRLVDLRWDDDNDL